MYNVYNLNRHVSIYVHIAILEVDNSLSNALGHNRPSS